MDNESNQLLEVIHNDQISVRQEIEQSNDYLEGVFEVLDEQFSFTKELADVQLREAETDDLQAAEERAEERRSLGVAALPALQGAGSAIGAAGSSAAGFLGNMGKGILSNFSLPTLGSILRGGALATLGLKFGEEIGSFLGREIQAIFDAAGFESDVIDSFTSKLTEYTGPVLMGAGIGSIFGPGGAMVGAIGGYLVKYLGMDELYGELVNASSDEEKQKLYKDFGNQALEKLKENPMPALLLAGSLFGIKGILVTAVGSYLYTSLGLDRLFSEEGRADFATDIKNFVMAKVFGREIPGQELNQEQQAQFDQLSQIPAAERTAEQTAELENLQRMQESRNLPLAASLGMEAGQQVVRGRAIRVAQRAGGLTTQRTTTSVGRRAVQRAAQEVAEEGIEAAAETVVEGSLRSGARVAGEEIGETAVRRATAEVAQAGAREAAETIAVTTTKTVLKKLPFGLGLAFSVPFAVGRMMEGDFTGAGLEIAEGLTAAIPGVGTAVSLGFAGYSGYRDVSSQIDPAVAMNRLTDSAMDLAARANFNDMSQTNVNVVGGTTNNFGQAGSSGSQHIPAGSMGYISEQ